MSVMESAKIMFEIYQEEDYNRRYRVVFFTELNDHSRELEINRAMAGRHVYDGFIREWRKDEAKAIIADFVQKLNAGETFDAGALSARLGEHLV